MNFDWKKLSQLNLVSAVFLTLAVLVTVAVAQRQQSVQQYASGGNRDVGHVGRAGSWDRNKDVPKVQPQQCPKPSAPQTCKQISCSTCAKNNPKAVLCLDQIKKVAFCGTVGKPVESETVVCVSCAAPKPTCRPRPACLDLPVNPCQLPETADMCPKPVRPTCKPRPACLDLAEACLLPEPAEGWCAARPAPTVVPQ